MRPILKIENISKRYSVGKREHYRTLRESLVESVTAPARGLVSLFSNKGDRSLARKQDHVWALKDVSLEVMPGEVMGVIGRNGAGKSTLLKILSRITEPTHGRVELYGRVGSLLEVGTGFHPELTGRENIFLSGAILGMRRAEIARKFDEIVDFSEIEQFIDTPVKRYSSGMYVRLAFAVAAHLDPEILVVDEVLAVGDLSFQKRCLGKMGDVAREGRTILFVSHNMASIQALCTHCAIIRNGRLEAIGEPNVMVGRYMSTELIKDPGTRSLVGHPGRVRSSIPIMTEVTVLSDSSESVGAMKMGSSLSVRVNFSAPYPVRSILAVTVKTAQGMPIFGVSNRWTLQGFDGLCADKGTITCNFERLPLMPGTYILDLYLGDFADQTRDLDIIIDAVSIEVFPADIYGTGLTPRSMDGPIFCHADWTVSSQRGSLDP